MAGLRPADPDTRLRLRLPREDDLCELTRTARIIAAAGDPQLHLPWMYQPSPGMERQFLQRYRRALAHWKPESWHLPLAVCLDGQPIGIQDMWASDFACLRSVGTASWITRGEQGHGYGTEARASRPRGRLASPVRRILRAGYSAAGAARPRRSRPAGGRG